jgi:hypothetical protein
MKTTFHTLSNYDLTKINEFFNPRLGQIQWYCTSNHLADVLIAMGYQPTEESSASIWYFLIPENFRCKFITTTTTELKHW